MITTLIVVFVSLVIAMALGFGLGLILGQRQTTDEAAPELAPVDAALLTEIVEREAELIERLSRAHEDLQAHAVELAEANEEIACLLDELHDARSAKP